MLLLPNWIIEGRNGQGMNLSPIESKKLEIISWVRVYGKITSPVQVSNYSYHCFFSGEPLTKTLIVVPDALEKIGIVTINKSIADVQAVDIMEAWSCLQKRK